MLIKMQEFNIQRIGGLIYRSIVLQKGAILTGLSVAGGLIFISSLLGLRGDHLVQSNEFIGVFSVTFILLGIVFTFGMFKEVHNKKVNHFYFLLPASPSERIIAAWFVASIMYTLVFTVFAYLAGQFAIIIGSVFPDTSFHVLPIFSAGYWRLLKLYFLIQPVFLLGAITFSKNRIGKTLLVALLVIFILFLYNMILCFVFSGGAFDVFTSDPFSTEGFNMAQKELSGLGTVLFGIVLVPMMLWAAYFKIIEKEV